MIVKVAGLETGNDIISSTIVSSMERAAKSVGMVPHLLAREDLSLGQRYKFLRRVGGDLPYAYGVDGALMKKESSSTIEGQRTVMDSL